MPDLGVRSPIRNPTPTPSRMRIRTRRAARVGVRSSCTRGAAVLLACPNAKEPERHIEVFTRPPQLAATDRGFYSGEGERRINDLGVSIRLSPSPVTSPKGASLTNDSAGFVEVEPGAGGEARISRLEHRLGMARSRYKGEHATMRTALWAGIANNLVAIGTKMVHGSR
jgi:hypothetical protein